MWMMALLWPSLSTNTSRAQQRWCKCSCLSHLCAKEEPLLGPHPVPVYQYQGFRSPKHNINTAKRVQMNEGYGQCARVRVCVCVQAHLARSVPANLSRMKKMTSGTMRSRLMPTASACTGFRVCGSLQPCTRYWMKHLSATMFVDMPYHKHPVLCVTHTMCSHECAVNAQPAGSSQEHCLMPSHRDHHKGHKEGAGLCSRHTHDLNNLAGGVGDDRLRQRHARGDTERER